MINAKYPVHLHDFICDCFVFTIKLCLPQLFSIVLFQFPLVALEDIAKQ